MESQLKNKIIERRKRFDSFLIYFLKISIQQQKFCYWKTVHQRDNKLKTKTKKI